MVYPDAGRFRFGSTRPSTGIRRGNGGRRPDLDRVLPCLASRGRADTIPISVE